MRRDWLRSTARRAVGAWLKALRFFVPFAVLGILGLRADTQGPGLSLGEALLFTPLFLVAVYVGALVLSAIAPVPEDHPARYMLGWAAGWVAAVAVFVGASALLEPTDRSELLFAFILFSTLGAVCGPIYGAHALDMRWHKGIAAKRKDKPRGPI